MIPIPDERYEPAMALAADLAERHTAYMFSAAMVGDSHAAARRVRQLSEANTDQGNAHVQEFRRYQACLYGSIWFLMNGFGGYKLVKEQGDEAA